MRLLTTLCLLLLASPLARAQQPPASSPSSQWMLGLRAGATTPQLFNSLSSNVMVNLEGMWAATGTGPALFLDFGHVQPVSRGTHTDARFEQNGGQVSYLMTVQDVAFGLGGMFRLKLDNGFLPYLGAGMRLHLTKTLVEQYAGEVDLGSHTEQSTRYSLLGRLGIARRLGPGEMGLEVNLDYAPVEQRITGLHNTAYLGWQLSYLLVL